MNFRNLGSALEWAYLPDYVISGFLFCLLYDKLGFGASYAAHVTNNFIGIMGIIITLNSGK
jgi:membrane protease YdiL (CAAX protease family)